MCGDRFLSLERNRSKPWKTKYLTKAGGVGPPSRELNVSFRPTYPTSERCLLSRISSLRCVRRQYRFRKQEGRSLQKHLVRATCSELPDLPYRCRGSSTILLTCRGPRRVGPPRHPRETRSVVLRRGFLKGSRDTRRLEIEGHQEWVPPLGP